MAAVKIIDESTVAPPPGSVATTTIPITFFDMAWLFCCPLQPIFFFEFPHSTHHFTQTILPNLKHSLSLTLRHFYPFAANLTFPPPPHHPFITYTDGNSVRLTVAESNDDFTHLTSNPNLDLKSLHSLAPNLPPTRLSHDETHVVPTLAVQLTVFPNSGISFGFAFNHVAADGRCFNHFLKFWASIFRSDAESVPVPCLDRGIVKDPNGLSSIYLNDFRRVSRNFSPVDPSNKTLVTIEIERERIQTMKDKIISNLSKTEDHDDNTLRVSTFVVICALMWVIREKFTNTVDINDNNNSIDNEDDCYFLSTADCRERYGLSIPGTYFGNCLINILASARRRELLGESGVGVAVRAIGRRISEMGKDVLAGAERRVVDSSKAVRSGRAVTVAGSPKLGVYDTDFGWGRPRRIETAHIGAFGAFSVHEHKENESGVQIGLVVESDKLELFNSVFNQALDFN